jgi:hypothetical protein
MLRALTPEQRSALVAQSQQVIARAAKSGVVATCLCELADIAVYLACFPGREEQPRTVRRQPAFGDGWSAHMRQILDACVADGKSTNVLSFVFLLATDGTRLTMLSGFDSIALQLVPEPLADAPKASHDYLANPEARDHDARDARIHTHRYELSSNTG